MNEVSPWYSMEAFAWRYLLLATHMHKGLYGLKLFGSWQLISIGSAVGTVSTALARFFMIFCEQSLRLLHTV